MITYAKEIYTQHSSSRGVRVANLLIYQTVLWIVVSIAIFYLLVYLNSICFYFIFRHVSALKPFYLFYFYFFTLQKFLYEISSPPFVFFIFLQGGKRKIWHLISLSLFYMCFFSYLFSVFITRKRSRKRDKNLRSTCLHKYMCINNRYWYCYYRLETFNSVPKSE